MSTSVRLLAKLTCPHCWHEFEPEDSLWITKSTEWVNDEVLGEGKLRCFRATRFSTRGQALDRFGNPCDRRTCPRCHLYVPFTNFHTPGLFYSILGAPKSGKSYFIAAMMYYLNKTLAKHFGVTFDDVEPELNGVITGYINLVHKSKAPDVPIALGKTQTGGEAMYDAVKINGVAVTLPRPFLYRLAPDDNPLRARCFCFYDNAGEHFKPNANLTGAPLTQHLFLAETFFFLFDPTQDTDFRPHCALTAEEMKFAAEATENHDEVLQEAISRIRNYGKIGNNAKHEKPAVIVVTKFDAWSVLMPAKYQRLDVEMILQRDSDGTCRLRLDVIEEVSSHVRNLLMQHAAEFVRRAERFFREVVYIPVSAIGQHPELVLMRDFRPDDPELRTNPNKLMAVVRPRDVKPIWSEVPMLYSLGKWSGGILPKAPPEPDDPTGLHPDDEDEFDDLPIINPHLREVDG